MKDVLNFVVPAILLFTDSQRVTELKPLRGFISAIHCLWLEGLGNELLLRISLTPLHGPKSVGVGGEVEKLSDTFTFWLEGVPSSLPMQV
jgi:hypothetical protein